MKKRRVMLKLSGEVLADMNGKGYDETMVRGIARQVKRLIDAGVETDIIIGDDNYQRDRTETEIVRVEADQIGMLATIMNYIYVLGVFRGGGMEIEIFSPFLCGAMAELFPVDKTSALFTADRALFFTGDTGYLYFSTDTGIALRATELGVDGVLLAKSIDGVYTADPELDPDAKRCDTLTMQEIIDKKPGVIGLAASVFYTKDRVPLAIFDLHGDNAIADTLRGVIHGTAVTV